MAVEKVEDKPTRRVIRLQLTGDALESFMGGDVDLQVEIRQCVVEEFARKYIKTWADNTVVKQIMADELAEVNKMLYVEKRGIGQGWDRVLNPVVQKALGDSISGAIREAVKADVSAIERSAKKSIDTLTAASNVRIEQLVKDAEAALKAREDKAIKIIKEMLKKSTPEMRKDILGQLL